MVARTEEGNVSTKGGCGSSAGWERGGVSHDGEGQGASGEG